MEMSNDRKRQIGKILEKKNKCGPIIRKRKIYKFIFFVVTCFSGFIWTTFTTKTTGLVH